MNMPDYFEWFGIRPSLFPDLKALRTAYLEKSRLTHPDFHRLDNQATQDKSLELSTLNSRAYETLSKDDLRFEYLLERIGLWETGKNPAPSPDFLMEMMELNEAVEDLSAHPESYHEVDRRLTQFLEENNNGLQKLNEVWDNEGDATHPTNQALRNLIARRKYLLRLKQAIRTFATRP